MNKKFLDGKTYFPLTVQKQIIELRSDIEKNVQHAGQNFEIVKQAYNEIKVAQGKAPSKFDNSCSGCILEANKIIKNWFALYDKQAPTEQRKSIAPKFQPLTPIKAAPLKVVTTTEGKMTTTEVKEVSYKDLLVKFNETATPKEKEALLRGRKTPKKDELIEFFNGKI